MSTPVASRVQDSHARVIWALFLGAATCALLLLVPTGGLRQQVIVASLGLAGLGLVALLVVGRQTGVGEALRTGKFGAWASISFLVIFGLSSLTWYAPAVGSAALISRDSVLRALVLVGLGQVCWLLGYLLGPGRLLGGAFAKVMAVLLSDRGSPRPTAAGIGLLFAFGMLGQLLRVASGGFGYLQNPATSVSQASPFALGIYLLAHLGEFALIGGAVRHFGKPSARSRTALLFIGGFQLVVGLLSGNKEPMVMVVVGLVLAYAVTRRRLPARTLLAGAIVFLLFVVPFVGAYRSLVRGQSAAISVEEAFAAAPSIAAGSLSANNLVASGQYLSLRLREIDNVAIIVQKTPEVIPYRPLSEVAVAPIIGLIPRLIWAGKPILSSGYQFSQQYYNLPASMYTSTAITPQGDLLRHGGPAVLFLGMLFMGIGYRTLDRYFRPDADYRHLFFIIALFPVLIKYETDIVGLLASLPVTFLAAAAAARLSGVGRR